MKNKLAWLLLVAAFTAACGLPRHGHLYSPSEANQGAVYFPDSAANAGPITATLVDGERCVGRYATVPGPQVTWDDQEPFTIYEEDTQDGMAILDCRNGHLIRCNLTRDLVEAGMGRCVDNRGQSMSLYF